MIIVPVLTLMAGLNIHYAIGASIVSVIATSSGAAAREFKYKVKPSMIGVNIGIAAPMSFFPFGGAGQ